MQAVRLQNGTNVNDTLSPGHAFLIPRSRIHIMHNPLCDKTATAVGFLNALNPVVSESCWHVDQWTVLQVVFHCKCVTFTIT
jgi:hypothetical protein